MSEDKDFMLTDDMELDEIEDLPSFEAWATGMYKVVLEDGVVEDTINDNPCFRIANTLKEIMHCEAEDEAKPKVGSELGILCMRNNKFGAATWKLYAKAIRMKFPDKTKVSEINEMSKGFECIILVNKVKAKAKQGEDVKYFSRILEVLPA